jgi:hypothetical protein
VVSALTVSSKHQGGDARSRTGDNDAAPHKTGWAPSRDYNVAWYVSPIVTFESGYALIVVDENSPAN